MFPQEYKKKRNNMAAQIQYNGIYTCTNTRITLALKQDTKAYVQHTFGEEDKFKQWSDV